MELTGVLPLLKPKGLTSHDCVMKLRRILRTKKIGHTGTLDPDVTGVLPICIGRATKIAEYLTDYPKRYEGEATLGYSTTTEDASGELVEKSLVERAPSQEEVRRVFESFKGNIIQIPPMYSAVKVNGKKLYEYARAGQEVERPKREVHIYELRLLSEISTIDDTATFRFDVLCSKGTYVRTLAVDIGSALGYPAHMSALTRTAAGPFTLEQCVSLDAVEMLMQKEDLNRVIVSIDKALAHFPKIVVNKLVEEKVKNGSVLEMDIAEKRFTVYNEEGICLAIYQQHPTKSGMIKPEKMLHIK